MKNNFLFLFTIFNLLVQVFLQKYSVDTINLRWTDNGDSTNFIMTNTMSSNKWFASGLSNDQDMVINFS